MFTAFIILCVVVIVVDEAKAKHADLKAMRDALNKVEE
jgi:hypothetical protein